MPSVCVPLCVKQSTKGLPSNIDEAVWCLLWAREKCIFWTLGTCLTAHPNFSPFIFFLSLRVSLSPHCCPWFCATVVPLPPTFLSSHVSELAFLFQMQFCVKVQPKHVLTSSWITSVTSHIFPHVPTPVFTSQFNFLSTLPITHFFVPYSQIRHSAALSDCCLSFHQHIYPDTLRLVSSRLRFSNLIPWFVCQVLCSDLQWAVMRVSPPSLKKKTAQNLHIWLKYCIRMNFTPLCPHLSLSRLFFITIAFFLGFILFASSSYLIVLLSFSPLFCLSIFSMPSHLFPSFL